MVCEHLCEPHEGDELQQLLPCVAQQDAALVPARGELKPRESIHRGGVSRDPGDVAESDPSGALAEQRADPMAESGNV